MGITNAGLEAEFGGEVIGSVAEARQFLVGRREIGIKKIGGSDGRRRADRIDDLDRGCMFLGIETADQPFQLGAGI